MKLLGNFNMCKFVAKGLNVILLLLLLGQIINEKVLVRNHCKSLSSLWRKEMEVIVKVKRPGI